jgi:large subunit ribosomal protein L24
MKHTKLKSQLKHPKSKIRKDDSVIVLAGKDKGRHGKVTRVFTNKDNGLVYLYVSGINMATKHVRPNPNAEEPGGIKTVEAPIAASKVAIFNEATKKADRVGYSLLEDGRKVRIFKKTKQTIDA